MTRKKSQAIWDGAAVEGVRRASRGCVLRSIGLFSEAIELIYKGLLVTTFDWLILRARRMVQLLGGGPIGSITRRYLHPGYNCITLLDLGYTTTRELSTEINRRLMMADFRIFVTAPSADSKMINECLSYLRDWEDGSGDTFYLQTTKTIKENEKTSDTPVSIPVAMPGKVTAATSYNA
jgi:hypothetical protein